MSQLLLFFGDASFLVEEAVKTLQTDYPTHDRQQFEGNFNWNDVISAVSTVGLFGQDLLIAFKNPKFLTDTATDADLKKLTETLSLVENSNHVLVFYAMDKTVDQRRKGFTTLKKVAKVQQFQNFKDWEQDKLKSWFLSRVASRGKQIAPDAADLMVQACGTQLRILANELEKLLIYVGDAPKIGLADVHEVCTGASSSVFVFSEAMKTRNKGQLLTSAMQLMNAGDDPIKVMGLVAANLRLYIQLLDGLGRGESPDQQAKSLGKNPFFLKRLIPEIKRSYRLEELCRFYQDLAKTDLAIKTGRMQSQVALTSFLATL